MASVEIRPGDTLSVVWPSIQKTPFGKQEVESSFQFTYDDLLKHLQKKSNTHASRRSSSEGARFSRIVSLSSNALRKGHWATGAEIDRQEVFQRLYKKFSQLDPKEYQNITINARKAIIKLDELALKLGSRQLEQVKEMQKAIS